MTVVKTEYCVSCGDLREVFDRVPSGDEYETFPVCSQECRAILREADCVCNVCNSPYSDSMGCNCNG